ncbi:MFS transporter [Sphingomonas sp. BIUV-7]|uniref:MFS transporter n=1 Tax=Sphingomonas natans TaxID=3063330 RepID=A0ABT8YD64_9SPHN|nr:MFS transporter [Sphingomonas sp. BIUV-7]
MRSAYGAGHFAKSLAWSLTDLLIAYYANMRLGLSAADTGLLIALSTVQGAAIDVGAAYLLRRAEGLLSHILVIQFVAGLATAAMLLLLFRPGESFAALLVTLGGFRIAYAFYDVSQNALVSLLPEDEAEADLYVVIRQTLSGLARLAVAGLAFLLLGRHALAIGRESIVAGAIGLSIAATAGWMLRWKNSPDATGTPAPARTRSTPVGLARLLLAGAALAGPEAMAMRMVPFVEGDDLGGASGAGLLFALVLGTAIGPLMLRRAQGEPRRPAMAFTALAVAAAIAFLAGSRTGPAALWACFAHGVGIGGMMTLFWREMSVAIRSHARRTGERTDMFAFALLTATIKLSGALCGGALALLLDGFKAGAPAAMAALAIIIAAGGLVFLLAMAPGYRNDARSAARAGSGNEGFRRATPPPRSRTT